MWIVEIPGLDGHEQRGFRPAIFIADTKTSIAIVVPCTLNIQALRLPFTLRIEPTRTNSFDVPTIALVLQLRAIDKNRLKKKIGKIENAALKELNIMIRDLLAL